MSHLNVRVQVTDLPAFHEFVVRIRDFIDEYAWHTRDCRAIDADGEWHRGDPACSCGYDEARDALTLSELTAPTE